jgi:UMF1 family MFS transporter
LSTATLASPVSAAGGRAADLKGQIAWPLFQAGRDVYVIVCVIYIFSPYVSTTLIGDPVRGQALLGEVNSIAGLIVALAAPFLGAVADLVGRRKPWIAAILLLLVPSVCALWWAEPAGRGLPVALVLALIGFNWVACAFTEVFHNSMLPSVAPRNRLGFISGLGLAFANAATLGLLGFLLYGFMLPGQVDWSFIPTHPLFGVDVSLHENSRIAAPLTAVCLVVFSTPFFLFTPDAHQGPRVGLVSAVRGSLLRVWGTVRSLKRYRNVATFLLARMAVNDACMALALFTGVYASGVFHWGPIALTVFGIALSPFAILGNLFGGWLDDRFSARRALMIEISGAIVGVLLAVSMTPTRLLFYAPFDSHSRPIWSLPFFSTVPELAYLASAVVVAFFSTGTFSSGRTMLARLAPMSRMSEFFGLYALSGTATAFIGPALVGAFTAGFHSQRVGFASTIILLVLGLAGIALVKESRAPD